MDNFTTLVNLEDSGLFISSIDESNVEDVMKSLRRLSDNETAVISSEIRDLIHGVADALKDSSIRKSFEKAIGGSFVLNYNPVYQLGKSHSLSGAYSPNLFYKGKLKGQANLIPNSALLETSKIGSVLNCAMNINSFITGQYFMAQINNKFESIDKHLSNIIAYLENNTKSEISSIKNDMEDILNHIMYWRTDIEWYTGLNRINDIKRIAGENIKKCINQIKDNKVKNVNKNFPDTLNEIFKQFDMYTMCLNLYSVAVLVEIYIINHYKKHILDEEYMEFYKSIKLVIDEYYSFYDDISKWAKSIIDNDKALNVSKAQIIGTSLLVGINDMVQTLKGEYEFNDDNENNLEKPKKLILKKKCLEIYEKLKNNHTVNKMQFDSILNNYDEYIMRIRDGYVLVKYGNSYYTNLPELIGN